MNDRGKRLAYGWENLLAGPDGENYRLAVKHGAAYLEERGASDWAEKILAAAAIGQFQMSCGGQCAVGTVLGDYQTEFVGYEGTDQIDAEGAELSERCGFEVPGINDMWQEYAALEQAWIDLATERAGK